MGYWALVLTAEEYANERLFANVSVPVTGVALDDQVIMVAPGAAHDAVCFGLGRVRGAGAVTYTHRIFDEPLAFRAMPPGLHRLDADEYAAVADRIGAQHRVDADKRTWLVSVDLPIEAATPAEAVREFWTYVLRLGPSELPAYVSPSGDELAMTAYVLSEPANQDPEED